MENCPNCGAKINPNSFFSPNSLLSQKETDLINLYTENKKDGYCTTCGFQSFESASASLNLEIDEAKQNQKKAIASVLCLNLQSPLGWDYEVVNLVTAQSTMGTGFFTDLTSGLDDFFGLESGAINRRISTGEENCLNILKSKCLKLGGNAVIGVDIDYSEIGGQKSLVMVCMTGTAIRVKNTSVFPDDIRHELENFKAYTQKVIELERMK